MIYRCPGAQGFRQPVPEIIECHFCKKEVEIWTDEVRARCSNCKRMVTREGKASCLDWCKYAKQCIGDELYNKYIRIKGGYNERKNRSRIKQNKTGASSRRRKR